ncbi:hypothetical protein BH10ACI3_BH10ACI3_22910 [soil metagenome]
MNADLLTTIPFSMCSSMISAASEGWTLGVERAEGIGHYGGADRAAFNWKTIAIHATI